MPIRKEQLRKSAVLLLAVLLLIPCGLTLKSNQGAWSWLLADKLAGSAYVLFWCLFFQLVLVKAKSSRIIAWVSLVTCFLEFTQLYQATWLKEVRSTFWGHALLGSSFSWSDFPFYLLGTLLAYALIGLVNRL